MPMTINRSSRNVNDILTRAASDASFRTLLLSNPSAALAAGAHGLRGIGGRGGSGGGFSGGGGGFGGGGASGRW